MILLHISNGFANSKVHSNLAKSLDKLGIGQIVYCPVRSRDLIGGNQFDGDNIEFVYSNSIKSWYKFVYFYKERKLFKDLKRKVDLSKVDCIHAHTLFSDGGLAYKAHKEYGTKYVVALRNTDVNLYLRLMKHTYPIGREILIHAERIIFISPALKQLFEKSSFCLPIYEQIKNKIIVLPNGVDCYWLEHIYRTNHIGHNILYIGDFTPNKNVCRLINAVKVVREEQQFKDCQLIIVGGGHDKNNSTQLNIEQNNDFVKYLGKIYDKSEIADIMKSCAIFAMPSITETFGLVYIEALSQNLPIIYTKGQGVDGLFDNSVGVSVNPYSEESIVSAIKVILSNSKIYNNRSVDFSAFNWDLIAKKYESIYFLND